MTILIKSGSRSGSRCPCLIDLGGKKETGKISGVGFFVFVFFLWARRSETGDYGKDGGLCDLLCCALIGVTKVTRKSESPFNHSLNTELSS